MKEFVVISGDGATFDIEGIEVENNQVLDYIEAESFEEAKVIAETNIKGREYGAFEEYEIFEKAKCSKENIKILEDKRECNQGLYIFLSSPAMVDFCDSIIDDTVVELFHNKRTVLIRGILSIEGELLGVETSKISERDKEPTYSNILKTFINIEENEVLEDRLCELSDEKLLDLWRKMEDVQFEEYVNYHTKIKDCKNQNWL